METPANEMIPYPQPPSPSFSHPYPNSFPISPLFSIPSTGITVSSITCGFDPNIGIRAGSGVYPILKRYESTKADELRANYASDHEELVSLILDLHPKLGLEPPSKVKRPSQSHTNTPLPSSKLQNPNSNPKSSAISELSTTSLEDHQNPNPNDATDGDEIDPLDTFMEGIQEEIRVPPLSKSAKKQMMDNKYDDDEEDLMESFLKAKTGLGLMLMSDLPRTGYDSDVEVYEVAKAVDARMVEYDSDANLIMMDKRKIEPILTLDYSSIEYDAFCKDYYEEKSLIPGMSDQDVAGCRETLAIRVSGSNVPKLIMAFEDCGLCNLNECYLKAGL